MKIICLKFKIDENYAEGTKQITLLVGTKSVNLSNFSKCEMIPDNDN